MRTPAGVRRASILAALGLTALAPPAGAATYCVAPNGSDAGPGSLAAPWRTIQKAANTVVAGDTVLVRSGTYAERVVLVASGTAGAEITFAAYPGEAPVIDGATVTMPDALTGLFDITLVGYVRVRGLRIRNAGPHRENAGILVDTSHHVVIERNSTYENVRVHDNVVYETAYRGLLIFDAGMPGAHPMRDLWLVHNTARENGQSGWGGGIAVDNPDATGVVVRNNIVSENVSFQLLVGLAVPASNVTVDHNLVDGFRDYPEGETRGTDYVEGDPLFAGAAAHDFHLLPGSPAIDRGAPTSISIRDYDGVARPQGTAPDLGAFEYPVPAPLLFYTVSPCRLVDTRDPDRGGPAPLAAGDDVVFVLAGRCGVPASARAVSLNVTVTAPAAPGHLRLYAADRARPLASTLNYAAGQTRANNAVVPLDVLGRLRVYVGQQQGTTHVVLDTNGYFDDGTAGPTGDDY